MPYRALRLPLALALLVAACDAVPRDNPLDPQSPAFRDEGAVSGRVTGIYPPFDGRDGVDVTVSALDADAADRLTETGPDGVFRVDGLAAGRYAVRAGGGAFRDQTDTVTVVAGATAELAFALDALPEVLTQAARTVHIERWFPDDPVFQLELDVTASDPDLETDVAGAALVVEGLAFREPLDEIETGVFAATLDASLLPDGRVQSLLGRTLRIEVTDRSGNTALGPPLALVRVIEQTPLTASPQGLETIAANPPVLEWRPAELPFAFTYRVEVFLLDGAGIPNRVAVQDGLPASAVTHALDVPLDPGDYFWTVWVVDEAGNRSRSKEAGFRVP